MNKKGQGISMTYIIIALLALVVLVVIILFFTGGMQKILGQTKVASEVSEQQLSVWRGQCKLSCSLDKKAFCEKTFDKKDADGKVTEVYVCNTDKTTVTGTISNLEVVCEDIKEGCA